MWGAPHFPGAFADCDEPTCFSSMRSTSKTALPAPSYSISSSISSSLPLLLCAPFRVLFFLDSVSVLGSSTRPLACADACTRRRPLHGTAGMFSIALRRSGRRCRLTGSLVARADVPCSTPRALALQQSRRASNGAWRPVSVLDEYAGALSPRRLASCASVRAGN
ncbi:Pyruvate dehydrogenase (Acetyl-transferring) kinase 2, mitochondrial [Tolypocladium capitatum]|uniref:Pyruvate dehydrogenase (Acetyl-transferring) kinase 2, mitochondrial n=1 Tax=Tolypocladium capitatum TaxID=45235 RepID=A0A2K3QIL6_9HYPO|nr:Pyruvate dehydrogenase (Acetyl-transferring) kinase 2, mitochondrial [Tolypocladium capitatum]